MVVLSGRRQCGVLVHLSGRCRGGELLLLQLKLLTLLLVGDDGVVSGAEIPVAGKRCRRRLVQDRLVAAGLPGRYGAVAAACAAHAGRRLNSVPGRRRGVRRVVFDVGHGGHGQSPGRRLDDLWRPSA